MRLWPLLLLLLLPEALGAEPLDPGRLDPSWVRLEFGANYEGLLEFLKARTAGFYQARIANTLDVAEADKLKKAMEATISGLGRDYVVFDGQRSGWDVSVVRGEFAHNSGESMLHIQEGKVHYHFFLFKGAFYKLVRCETEKPVTAWYNDLIKTYGQPKVVEFHDPETKGAVKRAEWEAGSLRFALEDKTQLYQCVVLRWVSKSLEEAVLAERKKVGSETSSINPLVQEAAQPGSEDDSFNPVDEILGRTPPGQKEEKPKGKPKKRRK